MQKNKVVIIVSVFVVLIASSAVVFASIFFVGNDDEKGLLNNKVAEKISEKTSEGSEIKGDSACHAAYEKVLGMNSFDFSECKKSVIRTGKFEDGNVDPVENNLVIIFDASGSMAGQVEGRAKIDIAKDSVKKYIDKLGTDQSLNLSIVAYGHKGSNSAQHKGISCSGIEDIYYMGKVNAQIAKSKIDGLSSTGWTPIARSLDKAEQILKTRPVNGKNFILLVSDGKETCDGDPIATVKRLNDSGLKITANVIGFDVGGEDEKQLKNIAEAGDGDYFSVKNAQEFDQVFQKHENILKKAHYRIGRTVEQIYDISNVVMRYNQCMTMLRREETAMMLDIHSSKLVGKNCEVYADKTYWERHGEIKGILEENFNSDKNTFNSLNE